MKKLYYDLHIHSALSPCSDNDMSPNNIINMALIKGLDIISITDHNSAKNVEVAFNLAKKKGLLLIPGIEVESKEGIHLLCYFKTISLLKAFSEIIYYHLPNIKNENDKWGKQLIFNECDDIIGKEEKLLITSVDLSMNKIIELVLIYQGIVFPAHINRYANSLITVLGFIPDDLKIAGIEIIGDIENEAYQKYQVIRNSDAHFLGDINEQVNSLTLVDKTVAAFFSYFGDAR